MSDELRQQNAELKAKLAEVEKWGKDYQRANDACEVRWNEVRNRLAEIERSMDRARELAEGYGDQSWSLATAVKTIREIARLLGGDDG